MENPVDGIEEIEDESDDEGSMVSDDGAPANIMDQEEQLDDVGPRAFLFINPHLLPHQGFEMLDIHSLEREILDIPHLSLNDKFLYSNGYWALLLRQEGVQSVLFLNLERSILKRLQVFETVGGETTYAHNIRTGTFIGDIDTDDYVIYLLEKPASHHEFVIWRSQLVMNPAIEGDELNNENNNSFLAWNRWVIEFQLPGLDAYSLVFREHALYWIIETGQIYGYNFETELSILYVVPPNMLFDNDNHIYGPRAFLAIHGGVLLYISAPANAVNGVMQIRVGEFVVVEDNIGVVQQCVPTSFYFQDGAIFLNRGQGGVLAGNLVFENFEYAQTVFIGPVPEECLVYFFYPEYWPIAREQCQLPHCEGLWFLSDHGNFCVDPWEVSDVAMWVQMNPVAQEDDEDEDEDEEYEDDDCSSTVTEGFARLVQFSSGEASSAPAIAAAPQPPHGLTPEALKALGEEGSQVLVCSPSGCLLFHGSKALQGNSLVPLPLPLPTDDPYDICADYDPKHHVLIVQQEKKMYCLWGPFKDMVPLVKAAMAQAQRPRKRGVRRKINQQLQDREAGSVQNLDPTPPTATNVGQPILWKWSNRSFLIVIKKVAGNMELDNGYPITTSDPLKKKYKSFSLGVIFVDWKLSNSALPALPLLPSPSSRHLPWFYIADPGTSQGNHTFGNLTTQKSILVANSDLQSSPCLLYSKDGWMLFQGREVVSCFDEKLLPVFLLNPTTGARMDLPGITFRAFPGSCAAFRTTSGGTPELLQKLSFPQSKYKTISLNKTGDLCSISSNRSDLIVCCFCPGAFLKASVGQTGIPEGDWYCQLCVGIHPRDNYIFQNFGVFPMDILTNITNKRSIFSPRCPINGNKSARVVEMTSSNPKMLLKPSTEQVRKNISAPIGTQGLAAIQSGNVLDSKSKELPSLQRIRLHIVQHARGMELIPTSFLTESNANQSTLCMDVLLMPFDYMKHATSDGVMMEDGRVIISQGANDSVEELLDQIEEREPVMSESQLAPSFLFIEQVDCQVNHLVCKLEMVLQNSDTKHATLDGGTTDGSGLIIPRGAYHLMEEQLGRTEKQERNENLDGGFGMLIPYSSAKIHEEGYF